MSQVNGPAHQSIRFRMLLPLRIFLHGTRYALDIRSLLWAHRLDLPNDGRHPACLSPQHLVENYVFVFRHGWFRSLAGSE